MTGSAVSFEASFIPRFEGDNHSRHEIETQCAQRTLWSAIQELLSDAIDCAAAAGTDPADRGPVVEVRLIAEPDDRRNRLVLVVRNVSPADDKLQSLIRVLPPDYGWRPIPASAHELESASEWPMREWHVARIERRLNFVDLPWRLLDTLDTSGVQTLSRTAAPDVPWTPSNSQERQLITRPLTSGELEMERYCLPVSGALEIDSRSLRVLFHELRAQAPCIVSISLAAVDAARLDSYRRIAVCWAQNLKPFGSEIANAGFANDAALRAQYDRFLLPDRFLCVLTMQVACSSAVGARSVALQLTARLGGLRSFAIRTPVTASLSVLGDPWSDVPHTTRWSAERWSRRRERLRREAAREGIVTTGLEPVFEDFLIELPHLYTIDEAMAVAGFPVADEDGLPGMDTRLIAPFSEPSGTGSFPATDAAGLWSSPPADRIRIGIAPNRAAATPGSADTNRSTGDWHTISPRDLTKHAFVVGSTGSGKTVTTLFLVRELARLSIPFLIIEPVKTEYFDRLKKIPGLNLTRHRFEGTNEGMPDPNFLAFDPMRLQSGVSVARHASYLKSCFEAAFPVDPATAQVLESGIRRYYRDGCRLSIFSRGGRAAHRWGPEHLKKGDARSPPRSVVHPSLEGFRSFFLNAFLPTVVQVGKDQPKLAEHYETLRQWFERRFEALMSGLVGIAAQKAKAAFRQDPERYNPFSELLSGRCILELDGIPDEEQKALMMAFIMTFLFEKRQADDLQARERGENPVDDLKHVLIVEEAHRVLANPSHGGRGELAGAGAQAKSVSLFVDMLAEIRAFGQGLIIVEQIPTKIVPEALKNTNLKIMLRLTAADDREFLGTAMNFSEDQKRFVTSLRAEAGRGVGMVVFEQQIDQPRLLSLPLPIADDVPIHEALFEPPVHRRN
nr:hypothetical protein [uncultured Rhodopila sp.]